MPPKVGGFTGELGLVSVFDLGQLLSMNGATGRLIMSRDDKRGVLYFENGQVVNAVDDHHSSRRSNA